MELAEKKRVSSEINNINNNNNKKKKSKEALSSKVLSVKDGAE